MKSIRLFESMLFVLVIFLVHSCTLSESDSLNDLSEDDRAGSIIRSVSTRGCELDYSVSEEDLDAYIKFKHLSSKDENFTVKSILPFPDANDPAAYVVNYSDYWEMVSADKRISPVIATGPGMFDPETENVNFMAWVHRLAEEVASLKSSSMLPENSENHILFWKLVSADKTVIGNPRLTRSGPDTLDHPVPGHYELIDAGSYESISSSVEHLISTKWGQSYPYNQYCPLDSSLFEDYYFLHGVSDNSLIKPCLAGCIPVAAGQLLYYYHYSSDAIGSIYGSAYCHTREFPDTDWTQMVQYDKSSINWSGFQTSDSSRIAAVMLANIGKGIHVHYHYNETGLSTIEPLVDFLLDEYGFECYYDSFNSLTIGINPYDYIQLLLDGGYPSMLSALTGNNEGHAFIVDRYKVSRCINYYMYHFVADDPSLPDMFEDYYYEEYSPYIRYFGMNWGWNGLYDDVWCVDTGDWIAGAYNFNNRYEMLTFLSDGSYPPGVEGQSISPYIR